MTATEDFEGKTFLNVIIGVVVTIVVYAVPVVQAVAPAVGAGVAGYLQNRGAGGGAKVGVLVAVISMIPIIALLVMFSGFIASVTPMMGPGMMVSGFLFVAAFAFFILALFLGAVGGIAGGMLADKSEEEPRSDSRTGV